MAIQAQMNHNASEFPLINNNGGIITDQSLKDFNEQALFHRNQQYRSQSFVDAYMEKQKQEIDQFIRAQNERLRYVLQEQRKQEIDMILKSTKTKALVFMKQREEEMSKALRKNIELEDLLRRMEFENQTWQSKARENENMVATLSSTLEQVRQRATAAAATCRYDAAATEDEGSFCGGGGGDDFPANRSSGCCLNCGANGETRVLFLPCRHLCCCTDCEASLVFCPICNMPKKNRIEAIIF
ncbi:unnamed protein product [Cochlearia groenlandica]